MIISPSLASGDPRCFGEEIRFIERCFDDLHVDIEDGVYLPYSSLGFNLAKKLCAGMTGPRSMHLMVHDPLHWIEDVKACGPDRLFIHLDHVEDPVGVLQAYRNAGLTPGLGLSDRDMGRDIGGLLGQVRHALVLTARIDDPLQAYDTVLEDFAAEIAARSGAETWVDGGVSFRDISRLESRGLAAAVMGRGVFQDRTAAERFMIQYRSYR